MAELGVTGGEEIPRVSKEEDLLMKCRGYIFDKGRIKDGVCVCFRFCCVVN